MTLDLQENRLSGTLPKWAGLTQASHAATSVTVSDSTALAAEHVL